jgi:hypothetical protein
MSNQKKKVQRIVSEADRRLSSVEKVWKADRESKRRVTLNASQVFQFLAGLAGDPDREQAEEICNAVERDPHLYLTTGTNCYNFGRIQCIALGHHENE